MMENEIRWTPPRLSDIKYSKISEEHKQHLARRKKKYGANKRKRRNAPTKGRKQ